MDKVLDYPELIVGPVLCSEFQILNMETARDRKSHAGPNQDHLILCPVDTLIFKVEGKSYVTVQGLPVSTHVAVYPLRVQTFHSSSFSSA